MLGRHEGFGHEGSGLFAHILRLADLVRPGFLFLENVPALLQAPGAMSTIVRTLTAQRGYTLHWGVRAASDCGAPHHRRRWFCLAVHRSVPPATPRAWLKRIQAAAHTPFPWRQTEPARSERMLSRREMMRMRARECGSERVRLARLGALGNAVVPDCVRAAFVLLLQSFVQVQSHPHLWTAPLAKVTQWPHWGGADPHTQTVWEDAEVPDHTPQARSWNVVVDPRTYRAAPDSIVSTVRSASPVREPLRLTHWATPRHGSVSASHYLSRRTRHDLATQVRFEAHTAKSTRSGQLNPRFAEWLMGFPRDWTCASSDPAPTAKR